MLMVESMAFSQKTAASSVCASDKAHNLRYDAVLDTMPRTNSIVSIACGHEHNERISMRKVNVSINNKSYLSAKE